MLMKNFFVIFTLLLLALADLGSSAPRKRGPALPQLSEISLQDIDTVASSLAADPPAFNVSKPCEDALNQLLKSGIMTCLPMTAILGVMGNKTLVAELAKDPLHAIPDLKPTFDLACAVTKCTDEAIQAAVKLVQGGCGADIAQKNPIASLIFAGLVIYSPAIDIICFKDHADEYCVIETDKIIASLPPPQVTLPGLEKAPLLESIALATPTSICTPCNKAMINTFFDYYQDPKNPLFQLVLSTAANYTAKTNTFVNLAVDVKCGINPFNDGKIGDPKAGPDPPPPSS